MYQLIAEYPELCAGLVEHVSTQVYITRGLEAKYFQVLENTLNCFQDPFCFEQYGQTFI